MNRRALLIALLVAVLAVAGLYMVAGRGGASAQPSGAVHHTHVPRNHTERLYAAQLLSVVDHSAAVFLSVARHAENAGRMGRLNSVCSSAIQQLTLLQARVDGVPHPFSWYSTSGRLHHRLLGMYHNMVGAAVACQTDAGNGDSGDAAVAVHQMAVAAQQLRRMDSRLHSLAHPAKPRARHKTHKHP